MIKTCVVCGKEFKARKKEQIFCSRECYYKGKIKSKNIYIFKPNHIEIIINSKRWGQHVVYIDKEDYEKVNKYNWCLGHTKTKKYVLLYPQITQKGKNLKMHRLIMECPNGKVIDHINHNTLDNRKENLRICSSGQNNLNRKTEKYKGIKKVICYKYVVTHRKQYLGTFNSFNDAYKAKKKAEYNDKDKEYFYKET